MKVKPFVVIDEVQKLPIILNEVQWMHENMGVQFALCGSSTRKVKKGAVNLLGGRAIRYEFFGLISAELKNEWNLNRMLNHGYLPRIYLSERHKQLLNSYVSDYLKEEVASEGLVRKLPSFSNFLEIASLSDTEIVNFSNIARDCAVSSQTIKEYFQILVDTLIVRWLPSFQKRPKRRVISTPKLYFSDVGVVNFLAKRGEIEEGSELFGKSFENWVFHEICAFNAYSERFASFSYWRLASGTEVDFIVNDLFLAIEAKSVKEVHSHHLKGLRTIKDDHPEIRRRIVVCLEQKPRKTEDGIEIMPAKIFTELLWQGELF